MEAKEAILQYKDWYKERYGFAPTEKLIDKFCKLNSIEIKQEEVAKVEEAEKYKICSILKDVATVTNAGTEPIATIPYTEANFRALETNYQNLLGEYEEVCAVTKLKDKENDVLIAREDVLVASIEAIIVVLVVLVEPFKDQMQPENLEELAKVERYLELKKGEHQCMIT